MPLRYVDVKTVRFASVVGKCGKPEVHLALLAPAKDRVLQAAEKAHRVMTVRQENIGTTADHGEVGLNPGKGRQFLIFPKSLKVFSGARVVGIKYDLVSTPEIPKSERAKPAKVPRKSATKTKPKKTRPTKKESAELASKLVAFRPEPAEGDADDSSEEITKLKKQVRRAMDALEDGKQVVAFNILKRLV